MNPDEFRAWLDSLVEQGRLRAEERDDLMFQRALFERYRPMIEDDYPGQVAGVVDSQLIVEQSVEKILDRAAARGNLIYFEPVPDRRPTGEAVSGTTDSTISV
jgi:hypothetical protein